MKRYILAVLTVIAIVLSALTVSQNAAASPLVYANSARAAVTTTNFQPNSLTNRPQHSYPGIADPPVSNKYTIKAGDTLAKIATSHNIKWQGLYCINKRTIGSNPGVIYPGTKLTIGTSVCNIPQPVIPRVTVANYSPSPSTHHSTGVSTSTNSPSPSGSLQAYALQLLGGNETQYACLSGVIAIESGWNVYADNPGSGAYGIPQALPGSKMSVAGSDWATDGYTQLRWMIDFYIPPTYGNPCGALQHEHDFGW